MGGQIAVNQERLYAIAVRDGIQLSLFVSIRRSMHGDVYVNFPRDHEPTWKPHSSYHASGQHHQKSFGYKLGVDHRQKPSAVFQGTENVVTTGIAASEPRSKVCVPAEFDAVCEIPVAQLRPETYRTYVSVDLTDPNGEPIIYPGAKILQQTIFQDCVPWIVVTLFDTRPNQP